MRHASKNSCVGAGGSCSSMVARPSNKLWCECLVFDSLYVKTVLSGAATLLKNFTLIFLFNI